MCDQNFCGAGVVTRVRGFLKKYKGRGFGKSLPTRAGVGMESNLKVSERSVRTFSIMTAEC